MGAAHTPPWSADTADARDLGPRCLSCGLAEDHQVSTTSPLPGIYEFGNNGGLVVLAPHKAEGPTNMVQFSVDQGACWHDVVLPESILVDNIRWVMCRLGTVRLAAEIGLLREQNRAGTAESGWLRTFGSA